MPRFWRFAILALALPVCAEGELRTGMVRVGTRMVTYQVRGAYAVVEDDIIVGTAGEMDAAAAAQRSGRHLRPLASAILPGATPPTLWPDGIIYYTIDSDIPNQQRLLDAIQHWSSKTPLRIVPRNGEANYVRFVHDSSLDAACSSWVGMRGGEQAIQVTDSCSVGSAIHELGHAWGLLHEHSRIDRNSAVTIVYQNADKRFYSDFAQRLSTSRDIGYYDYDSIMHYGPSGFSRNGFATIETVPVGIPIGQRNTLSAGDIDAVSRLYGITPETTTITTAPAGLPITVDGVKATAPQSFHWAPDTTHTISVALSSGTDPRYTFVRWSDGGEASHTITASRDQTVFCAVFQVRHRVSAAVASGSGAVTLAPRTTNGYYPERQPVRITATAGAGTQFRMWSITDGQASYRLTTASMSTPVLDTEANLAGLQFGANFTPATLTTVDSQPPGRSITVDGANYVTPARFAWTPGSTHTVAVTANQTSGNNTVRYEFTGWEDGTAVSRTVTAGESGATYTAAFTTRYLLSTAVLGQGTVSVSPPSTDGYYVAGTVVQLSARPSGSNVLRCWIGDVAGGNPTPSVTMSQQRAVTAYFASPIAFRVVNAASYTGNTDFSSTGTVVAPGQLVTLFGTGIGPPSLVNGQMDDHGRLATSLGGTRVLFDGVPAPLIYAAADQISAVVPGAVDAEASTVVRLERDGRAANVVTISTGATAPALFTLDASGKGQIAALNEDGTVNSPDSPAAPGSMLVLYATGAGLAGEEVADGQIMGSHLVSPRAPVYVRFGKLPAEVAYAGSAPGLVNGVLQVNVRLPAELLGGSAVPIQLICGASSSPPGTTVAVQ